MRPRMTRNGVTRGIIAPLTAVLLPVILMLVAFTTDIAIVTSTKTQLSTAADSAALAAAISLVDNSRLSGSTNLSSVMTNARAQAVQFASYNKTLSQSTVIDPNTSNSADGDVVIGYLDSLSHSSSLNTDIAMTSLFNSVKVTTRRTSASNGLIPASFGRLMGYDGYGSTFSSTATAQKFAIQGFNSSTSRNTSLIPMALSSDVYNQMISKQTSDDYSCYSGSSSSSGGCSSSGCSGGSHSSGCGGGSNTITLGSDGICESNLYPNRTGSGNWGTVRIGVSNNGTSTLSAQIANGVSTDVMAPMYGSSMALNPTLTFSGNPGISLGIKKRGAEHYWQNRRDPDL